MLAVAIDLDKHEEENDTEPGFNNKYNSINWIFIVKNPVDRESS